MHIPLKGDSPSFNNDAAIVPSLSLNGLSGFFPGNPGALGCIGGDNAISAIATVHIYGNRRWLGWYNNPGSFQIAKRLRKLASSASYSGNFGVHFSPKAPSGSVYTDPTALFKLDCCKGPKFRGMHSGIVIEETSYLTALLMKECAAWDSEGKVVPGRRTQPVGITIIDLGQGPGSEIKSAHNSAFTLLFARIPIAASIGTCVLCALREDWYASSLILVGILVSGISCLVLGSADLVFTHPEPVKGSPAGDGIITSDKDIILLKGTGSAINAITCGKFSLRFSSKGHYNLVRYCSILFVIQCIAQLLLIPQASLFGQIMFLVSLGISALYNALLSSLDKDEIHQRVLFERVLKNPTFSKYTLGNWTTGMVFMLLVLRLQEPAALLNELLPDDTKVWRQWKATILEQLCRPQDQASWQFDHRVGELSGFTQEEKDLLKVLYEDARVAYNGYSDYLRVELL